MDQPNKAPHYMQVQLNTGPPTNPERAQDHSKMETAVDPNEGETQRIETKMGSVPQSEVQNQSRPEVNTVNHSSPMLAMHESQQNQEGVLYSE